MKAPTPAPTVAFTTAKFHTDCSGNFFSAYPQFEAYRKHNPSRTMDELYELDQKLGQGQWGTVFRGVRKDDSLKVAIKRVRPADPVEGVNFQVLREIKMLKGVVHPNVIHLLDIVAEDEGLCMIFELMATDLEKVLYESRGTISDGEAKGYAAMLLEGLAFLHAHYVLHRDIKPANLLISGDGVLKLADFGYARYVADENRPMSDQCCTLWYRPPELLFGATEYDGRIDAWSAGCVLAEVWLRRPLFKGDSELDQLAKIFQITGVPDDAMWPGVASLRKYVRFSQPKTEPISLRTHLQLHNRLQADCVDLILGLLALDPKRRDQATKALDRPFFSNAPRPICRSARR